jgi:hypothetical protein
MWLRGKPGHQAISTGNGGTGSSRTDRIHDPPSALVGDDLPNPCGREIGRSGFECETLASKSDSGRQDALLTQAAHLREEELP